MLPACRTLIRTKKPPKVGELDNVEYASAPSISMLPQERAALLSMAAGVDAAGTGKRRVPS